MKRTELFPGVTRIRLAAEDAAAFEPILFEDGGGGFRGRSGPFSAWILPPGTAASGRPPTGKWSFLTRESAGRSAWAIRRNCGLTVRRGNS